MNTELEQLLNDLELDVIDFLPDDTKEAILEYLTETL